MMTKGKNYRIIEKQKLSKALKRVNQELVYSMSVEFQKNNIELDERRKQSTFFSRFYRRLLRSVKDED
jgi:hypothetical protein